MMVTTRKTFTKLIPHVLVAITIFLLAGLGSGYRYLSQDETETAERGRTIVESGFPRVIDQDGKVSVFAGGREIEGGVVHRYTPWGQFYAAALGIGAGRLFGIHKDRAVRTPFVVSHALTSGLISFGLSTYASVPVRVSVIFATLSGIQTDRLIHNRTARYHALLDLFLLLGLMALAAIRTQKKWGGPLLACTIFILPHIHTMSGSLISLLLGVQGGFLLLLEKGNLTAKAKKILLLCVVPGLISLILLLILTRPWMQSKWGTFTPFSFSHSFHIQKRFLYSYIFLLISGIYLFVRGNKLRGSSLVTCFILIIFTCLMMDRHTNAQYRYYLPIWSFCMLWPLGIGWGNLRSKSRTVLITIMFLLIILPEFTTRRYHPYHGLELVIDDMKKEYRGTQQPIHEVINHIRENGKPEDAVLFDSVPMMANWYLPEFKVALMPDETERHLLNQNNPIWDVPLGMPDWHVWYPDWGSGVAAILISDFQAMDLDMEAGRYKLFSRKLSQTIDMCVEKYWLSDLFNNNALFLYEDRALRPTFSERDVLVVAKRCDYE
jgi:hypothetical protein